MTHSVSVAWVCCLFFECMKTKIQLGKAALISVSIQITAILKRLFNDEINIIKIKPERSHTGNFLWVDFNLLSTPGVVLRRRFAMQRVNGCTDVWMDSIVEFETQDTDTNAA